MNEAYTTDFIARCLAAEALEKAEGGGSNVADVDASVSNSQLTIQLEDGNGTPVGSGATVNLPSGLPPSTSADEGKVLTVNSSGNAEWDENEINIFRTSYVDMVSDCTLTVDGNSYSYEFDAPTNFEKVDVYIRCHYIWKNTTWTGDNKVAIAHQLSITPDQEIATDGRTTVWKHGFEKTNMSGVNWQGDLLDQAIKLSYDSATNKLKMTVGAPAMWRCEGDWSGASTPNSPVTVSGFVLDALGYVAYGSEPVIYDGLQAGAGIDITNDVISIGANYGASFELSINSSTYVVTATLKDQNGNTLGQAQTIDLPLESVVVNGAYDDTTKKIILTLQNGNTVEFSVADLVAGLQTELSANNKLNPAYINYNSTHRAVSDSEKATWNGKQSALSSTQLSAVNSGIDSIKVGQISANQTEIARLVDDKPKNVLNITKQSIKSLNTVGTWSGNTYTRTDNNNNISITMNDDMSFTINGTTESRVNFYLKSSNLQGLQGFILSGGNTNSDTISVLLQMQENPWTNLAQDFGTGVEIPSYDESKQYALSINISAGTNANNILIKPMLCTQNSWNYSHEFMPYTPSNAELYAMIQALQS